MRLHAVSILACVFVGITTVLYVNATCEHATPAAIADTTSGKDVVVKTARRIRPRRQIPEHLRRARRDYEEARTHRRKISEAAMAAGSGDLFAAVDALSLAQANCLSPTVSFAECIEIHLINTTEDSHFLCGSCMEQAFDEYRSCALEYIHALEPSILVPRASERIAAAIETEPARLLTNALEETAPLGPMHIALLRAARNPILALLIARESGGSADLLISGVLPTFEALQKAGHKDDARAFAETWGFYNSLFVQPASAEDAATP